ncbi:class I SAM-dependent methyltransferase [Methanooceanicella nereidis]|uniref:class I SAM-dependent methyltransferase n=1 Tax=Methanooceanicella nereidis TaxID=2052831 RepID=UPI001E58EC5C
MSADTEYLKKYNAETYNEASEIYDSYKGLFFPYLFGRIREIIENRFTPMLKPGARVLDIGCGTGQQTMYFKEKGFDVVGVDISKGLVKVANKKLQDNKCIVSDACKLPFRDSSFDAISSAGSTLNHIPDYHCFFEEICRVLKPGGVVFLESDNKWRMDMFWCLASSMTGDSLDYHEKLENVLGYFKRPISQGYPYVFPLSFSEEKIRMLHLRTFTYRELEKEFFRRGCSINSVYGIHSVTNLIPSPLMLKDNPGKLCSGIFNMLSPVEDITYGTWPVNRLGMSIVVIAKKS